MVLALCLKFPVGKNPTWDNIKYTKYMLLETFSFSFAQHCFVSFVLLLLFILSFHLSIKNMFNNTLTHLSHFMQAVQSDIYVLVIFDVTVRSRGSANCKCNDGMQMPCSEVLMVCRCCVLMC